ncbi:YicC/YloC family endoribonuclease [Rapidithrix thailandica]|uniref:YicC/YloC family endoribonuclease n=1 Tax=Rapidithrix thailandica TaxID=413964 RepID=A0AAW9RTD7_9BACT
MIKSMTGYGSALKETENLEVKVEIRTLNSKFLDSNVKLNGHFSDKEIEIKNLVSKELVRGKVSLLLNYASKRPELHKFKVNQAIAEQYYNELSQTADAFSLSKQDILRLMMQMPDICINDWDDAHLEEDWKVVKATILEAIKACDEFRVKEGQALKVAFEEGVQHIRELQVKVEERDPERVKKIRTKLESQVQEFSNNENFDANRFEQELIYYIEKLDISEEKVRLKNHLNYLEETLNNSRSEGKKLGFICQEIGREINTIGSKANDAEIQRLVVNMKDELEKMKEQVLNVL